MAEEVGSEATTDAATTAPEKAQAPAPAVDVDKLVKEIEALRRESAERRVKAREAEEAAAAAEKAKAEQEGRWADVVKAEKAEMEALRQKLSEAEKGASKAARLASVVEAEVRHYEGIVGDAAQSVSHLSPEDRLPILKQFAALASTGKAQAARPAAGNPAGGTVATDFGAMTPEQKREALAGKKPEEIAQIAGLRKGGAFF